MDNIKPKKYLGQKEFGDVMGWQRQKVGLYYVRGVLPEPVAYIGKRPAWSPEQVKEFKKTYKPNRKVVNELLKRYM